MADRAALRVATSSFVIVMLVLLALHFGLR
jgi:hypothetical protein